jgi:hypothetical protein
MMKTQLMAGMALSIVLTGSLTPNAWSKDVATMHHGDRSQPTALSPDCELARNPNIRFFKAPNCTPDEATSPSMRDSLCEPTISDPNIESYISQGLLCQPLIRTKGIPQEIIYPKANHNIHLN